MNEPSQPVSPVINHHRKAGFTLVELMLSIAILAILVAMLGSVFTQISGAWLTGEGDSERRRNSRAITDFIAAELRSAVVPVEQSATPGKANLQFLINPSRELVPEDCANADTIFWQAPIATESSFGELAEVGYFVRWSEGNTPRPSLRRFFINPSRPNGAITSASDPQVLANPQFLIYQNPRWLSGPLIDDVAPATAPGYRGLFADNVLGFWVNAYLPDGKELLTGGKRTFDSRVGYKFENEKGVLEDRFLPAKVRVSLAQVDSRSVAALSPIAGQIQSMARRDSITTAADFLDAFQTEARTSPQFSRLLPNLRIYSTEIQLENAR